MPRKKPGKKDTDNGSPIIINDSSRLPGRRGTGNPTVVFRRGKGDTFTRTSDTTFQVFPPGRTIGQIFIPGFEPDQLLLPWTMHLGNGVILFAGDDTGVVLKFPKSPGRVLPDGDAPNQIEFGTELASIAVISPAPPELASVGPDDKIEIDFDPPQTRKARSRGAKSKRGQ